MGHLGQATCYHDQCSGCDGCSPAADGTCSPRPVLCNLSIVCHPRKYTKIHFFGTALYLHSGHSGQGYFLPGKDIEHCQECHLLESGMAQGITSQAHSPLKANTLLQGECFQPPTRLHPSCHLLHIVVDVQPLVHPSSRCLQASGRWRCQSPAHHSVELEASSTLRL